MVVGESHKYLDPFWVRDGIDRNLWYFSLNELISELLILKTAEICVILCISLCSAFQLATKQNKKKVNRTKKISRTVGNESKMNVNSEWRQSLSLLENTCADFFYFFHLFFISENKKRKLYLQQKWLIMMSCFLMISFTILLIDQNNFCCFLFYF